MSGWLQGFAYRISMGWLVFVLSGLLIFLIAMLSVLYQALKAATTNPINAIRYE
jgi:putative ABC transport system permease protein